MNDTLQLVIVLVVVFFAAAGLIRNIFFKTHRKSTACDSCPLECKCKNPNRKDCGCQ